jgi:hypothetical protein
MTLWGDAGWGDCADKGTPNHSSVPRLRDIPAIDVGGAVGQRVQHRRISSSVSGQYERSPT